MRAKGKPKEQYVPGIKQVSLRQGPSIWSTVKSSEPVF